LWRRELWGPGKEPLHLLVISLDGELHESFTTLLTLPLNDISFLLMYFILLLYFKEYIF